MSISHTCRTCRTPRVGELGEANHGTLGLCSQRVWTSKDIDIECSCSFFRKYIDINDIPNTFLRSPETWVDGSLVKYYAGWNLRDGSKRSKIWNWGQMLEAFFHIFSLRASLGLFPIGFPSIVAAMRSWDGHGTGGTPSPWEVRPPTAEELLIVPKPQQVHPEFPEQTI